METTTVKEVEGAMPIKSDFEYIRGLDPQGNPIRLNKADVAKVLEGLIYKYQSIKSFAELDNYKWNNVAPGTRFTVSWVSDFQESIHPAQSGMIEIFRFGDAGTLQRFTSESSIYVRCCIQGTWSLWRKIMK